MADYAQRKDAEFYDGNNAAHITDWAERIIAQYGPLLGWTLVGITLNEETDEISIQLEHLATPIIVAPGQWAVFTGDALLAQNDDAFQATSVAVPEPPPVSAFGTADVPAISLLNPTVPVLVNLSREFAEIGENEFDYEVEVFLVGARSMLTVNPAAVQKVDGNTVRVPVTASLAYLSGAQVLVMAHGRLAAA